MRKLIRRWLQIDVDLDHYLQANEVHVRRLEDVQQRNGERVLANIQQMLAQQQRAEVGQREIARQEDDRLKIVCALIASGHSGTDYWETADTILKGRK